MAQKAEVHHQFQEAKERRNRKKKANTKKKGSKTLPPVKDFTTQTTKPILTPHSRRKDNGDSNTPSLHRHRYRTRSNRRKLNFPNPTQKQLRQSQLPKGPVKLDLSQHLKLSEKQEVMVSFFQRQLQRGEYFFRAPHTNTTLRSKEYYNVNMFECVFTARDVAEFATFGQYCSSDMVKVSAMCACATLKQSPDYDGRMRNLFVLQESEMQLILASNGECGLATKVWHHVNNLENVLAVVLGRPRGVHWVGVFVSKIRDRAFELHSQDSNPKCGGDPSKYCQDVQSLVIRCADLSCIKKSHENELGLEFILHAPPSWQHKQRAGSTSCGHHQAANCVMAALSLMDTHIVDDVSVNVCKRHTLWKILKQDNEINSPYQFCGEEKLTLPTRDVFVKYIDDHKKVADCRPAHRRINNLSPGRRICFKSNTISV